MQQLSALIVQPAVDATKYTAGAQEKVAADKAMAASSREAGAAAVDTSAKIGTSGDVLARLSRQYVEGYSAQQRFSQGLNQLNRGLEAGKINVEGAERILVGMNQRLGLTANAAELAAKGQMSLAAAVERANVQIARQATDLAAADAAGRRMQVANSNVISAGQRRAAGLNAGQQLQDIGMMALVGQDPRVLALQQGPQLATAIQQGGGLAALGSGLASLLSVTTLLTIGFTAATAATIQWFMKGKDGAKSLDEALKAHSATLKLLKDQYGELGEAAKTAGNVGGLAFTDASARNAQTLLQAQLREKTGPFLDKVGGVGWVQGLLGNGGGVDALRNLSGDQKQFAPAMAALIESAKSGKTDLASFNDEVERLFAQFVGTSDNPARLRATADAVELLGNNAFSVSGKFAPFADAINRLKVEAADGKPNLSAFNSEVEKIGRTNGLQKLADEAIIAGKEIVSLAEKAAELEKILQRIDREETRPGLADRRALGGYVNRRAADLNTLNSQFDADQQMARARTNAERLAAVEAQVRSRAREDGDKGGGLQARVDRALQAERNRQAIEERDASIERERSQARSIEAAREELSLIGATAGETAKLNYQYSELARLKDEAAKRGGIVSDDEVRKIKETAAELGKLADARARLSLDNDLSFERSQMFRTPQEQAIASRLRGTGIDLNSPEADEMRSQNQFADAKGLASSFLTPMKSALLDGGKDIGKALLQSIVNAFANSADKALTRIFDQLATAFASAITGQKSGSGLTSAGSSVVGSILGGDNDNYAKGAVTRAPLSPIGGGSVAEQSWNFFKSKGLADHQVAGILGNIKAESAFNPSAIGDAGKAFGLFQNHSARGGGQGLLSSGVTGQLNHAWGELTTSESGVLSRLRGATDVRGATAAFAGFERPAGWSLANPENAHNFTGRLSGAEAALDKFGGTAAKATSSLGSLGEGMGKMGNALSQFPAAPAGGGGGGGGGLLGSLFGGLSSAFSGTKAFNWLSSNPGGFIGLYADGTENAPPGWAWVGERGPELMRMRGGETIRSNQNSMRMIADNNNGAMPAFSPVFNVDARGSTMSRAEFEQIASQQAQAAVANYQKKQVSGGFGTTQKRYNSLKG